MPEKFTNLNTDNAGMNSLTRFNGFFYNSYREPFTTGYSFIFVTKPLLFIDPIKPGKKDVVRNLAYNNMTRDPVFVQYLRTENSNDLDYEIVKTLSYRDQSDSRFIPLFTNECKSFEVQDTTLEQTGAFDTKQGYRQTIPTHTTASLAPNSVSLSMVEDVNLSITKMMTLWVNYINNVTDGLFDANPEMVLNSTLDYTSSIYHFILEPDGKTIKYWAKYTGCWPTNIPSNAMRYSRGELSTSEVTLQFAYNSKEEMNPKILEDFNRVSMRIAPAQFIDYDSVDGLYKSFIDNPLLNRSVLISKLPSIGTLLNSKRRDPVVFFQDKTVSRALADSTRARFELIFDDFAYKSQILGDVFDDVDTNYFSNFSANNNTKDKPDNFWD